MNFDKTLSIITVAGIIGLLILNYQGTVAVAETVSKGTVDYVKAVQGR